MDAATRDRYTVRISPELRRIRRGMPTAEPGQDVGQANLSALSRPPEPEVAAAPDRPPTRFRFGTQIRLRRDGERPLVFEGAPLARYDARCSLHRPEDPGGFRSAAEVGPRSEALPEDVPAAEQTLELFLAADGRVVVQLRLLVTPELAARPIHRVCEIASTDDLRRFLSDHGPEDAFCAGTTDPAGAGRRTATVLSNLRAEFARMTASLLHTSTGETLT